MALRRLNLQMVTSGLTNYHSCARHTHTHTHQECMRILRTCQNTRASRQLHTGSSGSACTALFSDNKAVFEKRCVYFLWNCVFFLRPVNRLPREEKSELTVLEISPLDWNCGCCFSDYVLTLCTSFDCCLCIGKMTVFLPINLRLSEK